MEEKNWKKIIIIEWIKFLIFVLKKILKIIETHVTKLCRVALFVKTAQTVKTTERS